MSNYVATGYIATGYTNDAAVSGLSIDWGTKIINVPKSFLTFVSGTNYQLDTNTFRIALKGLEDSADGMPFPITHNHNTTVLLGGIEYARVIEMINGYTITFENGAYSISLLGSNNNILDAVNLNQVSIRANNSAGLVNLPQITQSTEATKRLVEGLRPHHTGTGKILYWDPVNGSDTYDGLLPWTGCKTFAYLHDNLVTDYGHDIVICVSATSGANTVTTAAEAVAISKNFVFVRGPGRDFEIDTSALGGTGVEITGKGVELSGVRIKTGTLGTDDALDIGADFALIRNVWIEQCGGNAISIHNSSNTNIEGGYFKAYKGHGIKVGNSTNHLWLRDISLHGTTGNGDGLHIEGTSIFEVKLTGHSDIHANTGYGINIASSASRINIGMDVAIDSNTAGDVNDPFGKLVYDGRVLTQRMIAPAILATLQSTAIPVNLTQIKGQTLVGTGSEATPWGPA